MGEEGGLDMLNFRRGRVETDKNKRREGDLGRRMAYRRGLLWEEVETRVEKGGWGTITKVRNVSCFVCCITCTDYLIYKR